MILLFFNFGGRSRLRISLFLSLDFRHLCAIETHPGSILDVSSRQPHWCRRLLEQNPPTSPGPCILGLAWVIVAASITHQVGLQVTNTIKDHPLPKTELVLLFFQSSFCHREHRLLHSKLSSSLLTTTATIILYSNIKQKSTFCWEIWQPSAFFNRTAILFFLFFLCHTILPLFLRSSNASDKFWLGKGFGKAQSAYIQCKPMLIAAMVLKLWSG